jgi:competence protein ComEA
MKLITLFIALLTSIQLMAAVSLNQATAEELTALDGIGEKTAEKIIEYRKEHGFKDTREVMNIKGIGEKKYEKIKGELTL